MEEWGWKEWIGVGVGMGRVNRWRRRKGRADRWRSEWKSG